MPEFDTFDGRFCRECCAGGTSTDALFKAWRKKNAGWAQGDGKRGGEQKTGGQGRGGRKMRREDTREEGEKGNNKRTEEVRMGWTWHVRHWVLLAKLWK
jgi:hypothetical protein